MTTDAATDVLHESWLAEEIPCDVCDKPARLRSRGHQPVDCTGAVFYKCVSCWQSWYQDVLNALRLGDIYCTNCRRGFLTIEAFSDYREF